MKASTLLATAVSTVLTIGVLAATAPPAASSQTATSAPCGGTIYKSNGTPWVCTFDDEFSGTTLNPKRWIAQTDFGPGDAFGNRSCATNSPQNISVSAGALHLSVRKLTQPVFCGWVVPAQYSAGSVMTWHLWSQAYGRFTARMKVQTAPGPGLHEAFWLWHDERYTRDTTGEMDIAETFSRYPNIAIPNLHTSQNAGAEGVTTQLSCQAVRGYWNTYTMVWTPHRITISMNGKTCLVNTSGDPAFTKRAIILLSAVIGQDQNAANSRTPVPATTLVDYVRVWK